MRPEIPPSLMEAVRAARALVVLTGAGVSKESGIPTFRDALVGLWAKFDPEELATPEAFERDPAMVARWYDERRVKVAECRPNPGHLALADLERRILGQGGRFTLLTQNVDRLHQAAGSRRVVELHGALRVWRCARCGEEREEIGGPFAEHPPRCECGGARRPGVVWFGEVLPRRALDEAEAAVRDCDLFLSIGTSALVHPAAGLLHEARGRGASTAEINPERTPASDLVDWRVEGRSGEVLPDLVARAFPDPPPVENGPGRRTHPGRQVPP